MQLLPSLLANCVGLKLQSGNVLNTGPINDFFKSSCKYRSYIYSSKAGAHYGLLSKDAIFFGNLDLGERVYISNLPRTRPRVRFQGQVLNFSYYRSDDFGRILSCPKRNLIRRNGSFLNTQE